MTTDEIKTLLYNVFGVNFRNSIINNNVVALLPKSNLISVYINTDDYSSIYLDIFTTKDFYHEMISILNNQRIYGIVTDIDNAHCCISFVPYSELKNFDI